MTILNYKLTPTKELLTARIGLLAPAHLMQSLNLTNTIDQHLPTLKSNRPFKVSTMV